MRLWSAIPLEVRRGLIADAVPMLGVYALVLVPPMVIKAAPPPPWWTGLLYGALWVVWSRGCRAYWLAKARLRLVELEQARATYPLMLLAWGYAQIAARYHTSAICGVVIDSTDATNRCRMSAWLEHPALPDPCRLYLSASIVCAPDVAAKALDVFAEVVRDELTPTERQKLIARSGAAEYEPTIQLSCARFNLSIAEVAITATRH